MPRSIRFFAIAFSLFIVHPMPFARAADVVRIGVLADMSGAYADVQGAGSLEATRIAIEEFGGTVLGKKIEVVSADHQNKADLGSNIARNWIDNLDVGLILDLGNSAVAVAVQNLVRDKDRISIATGAASAELTNKYCNPNSLQWGYDTYQFAHAAAMALTKAGGTSWFIISADYALGYALEGDARAAVEAAGGKVLGTVRHPLNTSDYSSYLLQAQASGAKVIAIANGVSDLQNALKQGREFNIFSDKQKLAALAMLLSDVHSVGLAVTQGTILSSVFYWDASDGTRQFSEKFAARMGRPPSETQAMNYSATLHYLKSVQAVGSTETKAVLAKMRATPVNDALTSNASIRADGRLMRDIYLVQVKTPEESKKPWDYFKVTGRIAAADAFRPVSESVCPLLKS
ncbi:ABC transporter substrate-binding protein [Tardiphaga sp.]|uniref:ABC transporter substrate-binding protein n=1 Tax=Tardiphaga sp. TaxID=1926292 RepID=UPI0025FFE09C|nr:ABC transporter substrate-binding protein [Tardiphaga sp.]